MGDKFSLPNLDHMVSLVSLLARSSARIEAPEASPWSLPPPLLAMAPEEHELATHPTLIGESGRASCRPPHDRSRCP